MWPASWNARIRCSGIAATDVDVGRGDVDPELDAQRPPELQLLLEPALREEVDVVAGEGGDVVHGPDSTGAGMS